MIHWNPQLGLQYDSCSLPLPYYWISKKDARLLEPGVLTVLLLHFELGVDDVILPAAALLWRRAARRRAAGAAAEVLAHRVGGGVQVVDGVLDRLQVGAVLDRFHLVDGGLHGGLVAFGDLVG